MVVSVLIWNILLMVIPPQIPSQHKPAELNQSGPVDRTKEAEALYQQARMLIETRDYELAQAKLREAVRLWQQAQKNEQAGQALLQMGERQSRANRWQYALQCYHQFLQIKALAPQTQIAAFNALARLYGHLHQLDLAQRHYEQALGLAQKIQDPSAQAEALIGLATIDVERGLFEQARKHLEQAQRWVPQLGDEKKQAVMLDAMGRIYLKQGQPSATGEAFNQALALNRKIGNQEGQAQSLCYLSNLYLTSGQNQLALESATEALKLANQLKASELQWRAWFALARAQRALGRYEEASKSYLHAFGFVEMQRLLYISADAFRIPLLAERQAVYWERVDFLMERGDVDEAFGAVEHARSRATLDLLAEARRSENTQAAPDQTKERQKIGERVDRLRSELRSPQLSQQQRAAFQAELKEAEHRLEEARLEADMNRKKQFTRPVTLQQVQQTMLRANDVLLEFFLGDHRSYVWLISPEQVHRAALPGQQPIEEAVNQYLKAINTKPNSLHLDRELAKPAELAGQLFHLLLGPLAEHLMPGQRLIIAPDGPLYYLPFEALIRNGRHLIEDHEISYIPSASVLGLLQQSNGRSDVAHRMELLAIGDPSFGPTPETEIRGATGASPDDVLREIWSSSGYDLPSLPNTRVEVESISQFFPPERRRVYLGASATEEAIKRESLPQYRRIHFATHSLIDEHDPARSGVVLTLDDDPREDGLLEVSEIAELKLDCDLVVLSACQTGRGQLVTGEGIVGLTRAFLYAGARSVAVSLWSVSDVSTAQFMKFFYRHLAARLSAAAALRQAKLDMLRTSTAARHPYYWAAFVLVGKGGEQ
jgi:CHAT domain-containing protein